eukprot:6489626-Amphidinium_carterae.1
MEGCLFEVIRREPALVRGRVCSGDLWSKMFPGSRFGVAFGPKALGKELHILRPEGCQPVAHAQRTCFSSHWTALLQVEVRKILADAQRGKLETQPGKTMYQSFEVDLRVMGVICNATLEDRLAFAQSHVWESDL